ncbi:MAG: J domain-containing protein [Phycisphaerales bacterium]|nr:J domain-containing protein [Phycisphaerales bacterium]
MPAQRTHYETLGIPEDAPAGAIKRAFRALALRLHPDVNQQAGAAAQFAGLQQAYSVLNDPQKRAQYDAALAALRATPADRPPGEMHFTWSNIADRGGRVAEADDELFEELYQAFFETRASPRPTASDADAAAAGHGPKPTRNPATRKSAATTTPAEHPASAKRAKPPRRAEA